MLRFTKVSLQFAFFCEKLREAKTVQYNLGNFSTAMLSTTVHCFYRLCDVIERRDVTHRLESSSFLGQSFPVESFFLILEDNDNSDETEDDADDGQGREHDVTAGSDEQLQHPGLRAQRRVRDHVKLSVGEDNLYKEKN